MKLSCSSPIVPGKSLTDKAELLCSLGYEGIGIFIEYSDWNDTLYEEVLSLYDNTGITPCEFVFSDNLYGRLMDKNLTNRKLCKEMYIKAANICAQLGACTELEYEYGPQNPLPLFCPYQKMPQEKAHEFLAIYSDIASNINDGDGQGFVLIEPINRYEAPYLNTVTDCIELLSHLDSNTTGLLLDFFHMSIEESSISNSILKASSLIKHIHIADNNRLIPGLGNIDFRNCFDALKEINYTGFVSLECALGDDPISELAKTAKYLKSLI